MHPIRVAQQARRPIDKALLVAIIAGLVLLAGLGGLYLATPAPAHVAVGCLWWTAKPVDQVVAGDRGCMRGYFATGGYLADSTDTSAQALKMFLPARTCQLRPGDAMVVRGEAVFGEGRTSILVDECR